MKKFRQLFLLLSLLLFAVGARAETITLNEGTTVNNYVPVYGLYVDDYTASQFIISKGEIPVGCTISSMTFTSNAESIDWGNAQFVVYLGEVLDDTFSSAAVYNWEGLTQVYEGSLSIIDNQMVVTFDQDYSYNGGNLLVGFKQTAKGSFKSCTWLGVESTGGAVSGYNSSSVESIANYTVRNFLPQVTFEYTGGTLPSCVKPTGLTVENITPESATVSWDSDASKWNFQYKASSDENWTEINNFTQGIFEMSRLSSLTTYTVRVQSVCDDDYVTGWTSTTFTTPAGIPLEENFAASSTPLGWSQYNGLLDDVLSGTATLSSNGGWYFGERSGVFDSHAYVNVYGTTRKNWLVAPTLLMEDNVQLSFDVALTAYSGTAAAAQTTGTDDKFVVLITTDDGSSWEVLRQWDNAGSEYVYNDIATEGETVNIDLSGYKGQNIAVAFYVESTATNADNFLHLDNVSIDYIPSCIKPTKFTVGKVTDTEAELSWESDASAWLVYYEDDKGNSVYIGTSYHGTSENPYILSGLTPGTAYTVMIKTECGEDDYSAYTDPVSFVTQFCSEQEQCLITYELTDSYGDGWGGNAIQVVDEETGLVIDTWTIKSGKTFSGSLAVCPGQTLNFEWVLGSGSQNGYPSECSFVIYDVNDEVIFEYEKTSTGPSAGQFASYLVDCTASPCRKPADFAASDITYTTATLSWTEKGESTSWIVYYMAEDDTEISTALADENPFVLEGLEHGTTYYAMVAPTCDEEKTSEIITFTTPVACEMPTNLTSTVEAHSATISWEGTSDSYTVMYKVASDSEWTSISTDEETITITGLEAETDYRMLLIGTCGDFQSKAVYVSFTTAVACEKPTNLAAATTPTSATLKWTGYSDAYNVRYRVYDPDADPEPTFFEDFEGSITGWSVYDSDNDGNTWGIINAGGNDSAGNPYCFGSRCAYSASYDDTNGALTPDNWLATPLLDLQGTMKVWLRGTASGYGEEHFAIYLVLENSEEFIELVPETVTDVVLTEYTADLSDYEGQKGNIYIRHFNCTDQYYLFLDNFGIYPAAGEGGPWTVVSAEEAPFELTGLDPETTYEFQVQGDCGEDLSKWSSSSYFTTLEECPVPFDIAVEPDVDDATVTWTGYSDLYNLRYRTPADVEKLFFEDFEHGIPSTWTTIDADGDGYNWYNFTSAGSSTVIGTTCATSASYITGGTVLNPDNWLITPQIELGGTLSVWLRGQDPSWAKEHFAIYLSTRGTEIEDFSIELVPETEATGAYVEYTADLSSYSGTQGYIAIRHFNCNNQFRLNVDNFALLGGDIPAGKWTTVEGLEDTEYVITDLEPNTNYELQVQGECDRTQTEWSEVVPFTTLFGNLVLLNDDYNEETKNSDILTEAMGKKVNAILQGRTFFKDGNWNSLYLPFEVSEEQIADESNPLNGATIKKLYGGNVTGTHVDIIFTDATKIDAGWWYIFKWNGGDDIIDPVFKNVEIEDDEPYYSASIDNDHFTVYGNYDAFPIDPSVDGCYTYYLTSNGEMKYSDKFRVLKTFRIFFRFTVDDPGALEFNLNFDDGDTQTGIVELDGNARHNSAAEGIYNLQGMKYNSKPIQKGIYINNGRKVVIK